MTKMSTANANQGRKPAQIRVRLRKIGTPSDAVHPWSDAGDRAGEILGYTSLLPSPGESFWVYKDSGGMFVTSMVTKILDPGLFKTMNSIYQYEILSDDQAHETNPGRLGETLSSGPDVPQGEGKRPLGRGIREELIGIIKKAIGEEDKGKKVDSN